MFDSNRKYINICTNIIYKTRRNSTNDPADASHGFDTNLMLKGFLHKVRYNQDIAHQITTNFISISSTSLYQL